METTISEFTIKQKYKTDRRGPVRWIFSHAIRSWYFLILTIIGALGNAALASLVPIYFGQAFNAVLANPPQTDRLLQIAILIGFTQLGRGLLQLARNFSTEFVAQRLERDVRNELYTSLLGKSMTFHSLRQIGDIMARATNDVREINMLINPGVNNVFGSINFLIMPLIVAPTYNPALILAPALFIIAYIFALWNYLASLSPLTTEVRGSFGQLNTRLAESLDGIEIVKGSSQEQAEIDLFSKNVNRYRTAMVKQGYLEARFIPLLLLAMTMGGGLLHALILYSHNLLNVGQVIAYFGTLSLLGFPTFSSIWAYSRISLGLAGARRILELINSENNLDQNQQGYAKPMRGEIEFQNVSFSYDGSAPALNNISFKVKPGQTVAIVGQTGSGKTTLVKLINRTYDTTQGKILVDNIDVREWNLEALRRNISIIEQDIFLFSRTISDNISFGKQKASNVEIENAAIAAQAHEFISTFSDGYQTVIGERGVTLSGGQRQRVAIARAFLTDPRILILDDSTSSIDSDTEDKIQRAIYAAARGRTTFIITHRLSQIRWADLILVMRQGHLAAAGTHEELLKTSEAYRRIFSE